MTDSYASQIHQTFLKTILASSARYIDAKEPIRAKLLFLSPIRSRKGAYQLKTTLVIDSDIKS